MHPETISIVIPSFNRALTLPRAINSILVQEYPAIEILVVDDCSSDSTEQVVLRTQNSFANVKYLVHSQNKGAQAARNTGAKAAEGQWIIFLDSDDYFLPCSIQRILDAARAKNTRVVHSECTVIHGDNFKVFGVPPLQGNICREVLSHPGPLFNGMLVHKEALERIGYLDEDIISYQEWDTSIRLAKHYDFAFVAEPTFVYDCRGSDTISKDMLRDVNGYKQVVSKHHDAILQYCGRGTLAEHWRQIAIRYKALGMQKCYLKYMSKSFISRGSLSVGLMRRILGKARRLAFSDSVQ